MLQTCKLAYQQVKFSILEQLKQCRNGEGGHERILTSKNVTQWQEVLHQLRTQTEREKAIGQIIFEVRLQQKNINVQHELQFLYQWISQSPVTINYGNYAVLDKALLLKVSVQIITYLIVIVQFTRD